MPVGLRPNRGDDDGPDASGREAISTPRSPRWGMTNARVSWLFAAALVTYYVVSFLYGSGLSAGGGVGWDGTGYTLEATKAFDQAFGANRPLVPTGLNAYSVGRLLPSFLLYWVGRLLGLDLLNRGVWRGLFYVYDCLLVLVVLVVTHRVAVRLEMSWRRHALLLLALCGNFCNLRFLTYYPTLTDTTAFFLGAMSYYVYLLGRDYWLLPLLVLGAGTWPTAGLFTGLLFVYPRGEPFAEPAPETRYVHLSYGLLAAGVLYLWFAYRSPAVLERRFALVSFAVGMAYIGYYAAFLPRLEWKRFLTQLKPARVALVAIILFAAAVARAHLTSYYGLPPSAPSLQYVVGLYLDMSLQWPAGFLAQQLLYFGPAMLLFLVHFPKIARGQIGSPGLLLTVLLTVLAMIGLEQRQSVFQAPILIFMAIAALDENTIDRWTLLAFAATSLIAARLFLPLNIPEAALNLADPGRFPQQFFFSTLYLVSYGGYVLMLITASAVALPMLIERAVKAGILPVRRAHQ